MKRNLLWSASLVLAIIGLLATAQPSHAQRWRGAGPRLEGQGLDIGGGYYGGGYYGRDYYGRYGNYPYYDTTRYTTQSYYYPQAGDQRMSVDPNAIHIRMNVPNDARVWFEGQETQQRGSDRLYVSPPMTPGKEYVYHLKAQWMENGRPVTHAKDVKAHAGDWLNVDMFSAPVTTEEVTPRP
jgi:uncharacterized protein (TIGR03000 family)